MNRDTEEPTARAIETLRAFTAQLRTITDADATVPGLTWTVEELGEHVLSAARYYTRAVEEDVPGWRDLAQGPAENDRLRRELTSERGIDELVDAITESASRLEKAWASRDTRDEVAWHGELRLPIRTVAALVLGDMLVHGWDLARLTHERWNITRDDAHVALDGLAAVIAHFVEPTTARDFEGTFLVRLRGGGEYVFMFDHGTLVVSTKRRGRVDCTMLADPTTFLLAAYGRVTPIRAAARGGILAYGRRPWLAFKLATLLKNP